LADIRKAVENDAEKVRIVDEVSSTFLFEGYIDHFSKMIPIPEDQETAIFPLVLAHNDA
jgi:hypothetical protein